VLAGYDATPAEEIPAETEPAVAPPEQKWKLPEQVRPTRDQFQQVAALIDRLQQLDPGTDWRAKARELAGVPGNMLTRGAADGLIRQLEQLAQ
jgi:hypothetical protein